jgi:hypothetical protein
MLLTLVATRRQKSAMKNRNISLVLAALVIVAAGCAVKKEMQMQDYPAKYVITCSDVLVDETQFLDFIRDANRLKWTSDLTIKTQSSPAPSPIPNVAPPSNPPPFSNTSTIVLNGPTGLHVTQKIGLYRRTDLKDLIGTLSNQN